MESINLIKNLSKHYLSTLDSNFNLVASDGCISVHFVMLAVHSPLLKDILLTVDDPTECVLVIPDTNIAELSAVMKVMCGKDDFGIIDKFVFLLFVPLII